MTASLSQEDVMGLLFDIDTFAVHDGPGIRMAVYPKGCPLTCAWCHSPESQHPGPELVFFRDRCALCGACVQACPQGVHAFEASKHTLDRRKCLVCGRCVEHCPQGALAIKGYWRSASSLVREAGRMKPFFAHSGGGVTLTGGEVTLQADFAAAVIAGCHSLGIHTAVETSGACSWDRLARVIEQVDLVLFDIKLIDESAHRRWTGASNQQILDNAARLAGRDVQVRIPLIPGITDTRENVEGIYDFMHRVGLQKVALLPYNAAASAKYEWFDLPYRITGEPQSQELLEHLRDMAHDAGLTAVIDG